MSEFLSDKELKRSEESIVERTLSALALGRFSSGEDVAKAIVLSLSDASISGETIFPSGGLLIDRLTTSGDFTIPFYPALREYLKIRTVMIIGDSMFDEMANTILAYHQVDQVKKYYCFGGFND